MKNRIALNILVLILGSVALKSCERDKNNGLPVDIDGNVYNTVELGTQTWLKENLKTTRYAGGGPITLAASDSKWKECTFPAYCWYNNDENLKDRYGALYNWYVVKTGVLCPFGYHVPTVEDWTTLAAYLNDAPKETSKSFIAQSIGIRWWDGHFFQLHSWWISAKEESDRYAWCAREDFTLGAMPKDSGYPVRCVKDKE